MAGTGPAPKTERRRRNESRKDTVAAEIESADVEMPADLCDVSRLNIRTQEYLAAIVTSPQAQMYQPTDWMRVRDLLILKDMFYRNQSDPALSLKLSSEIRQLEAGLLFTHSDRVKAGVKIKPAIKGEVTKAPPPEDDVLDGVF